MRRTMEVEEQNFEAEEWGIAQQMQRILGEIHYLMSEQIRNIQYYSDHPRNYYQVKTQLEKKEDSVISRLDNYKKLYQQYIGGKQIYHQISQFIKDNKLLNQKISKLLFKEHQQIYLIVDNPQNQGYEIEEIKDPKYSKEKENQIIYYRKNDHKWFFIRIIKNFDIIRIQVQNQFQAQIIVSILDIEVFLCDESQIMEKQDKQHELDIMKQVNQWFKQLIFNVQNKKLYKKYLTEIIQYIEETMKILFIGLKCATCNKVFLQTEDGKFVQPCVKINENDQLHHFSCLFK
ncbi:unnamed protein product [Paramecium sonneborni]|uniref:Uncharacterized protein n=1 Tax=Paramecium sonneborni TaxID=65129 RepID=A0A8S1PAY6_9CILI|nr:unnamed protein product [Paramecium sonneborni]